VRTSHPFETYGTGPEAGNAGYGDVDSAELGRREPNGHERRNIATATANGSPYRSHTTTPTAGGCVADPYDITSKTKVPGTRSASMTSNRSRESPGGDHDQ